MSRLAFAGVQTIGASAQPAFGTTTTAAATPTYDQFAGNVTGANPSVTIVAVTSAAGFFKGQNVWIGTSSDFTQGQLQSEVSALPWNVGLITKISGLNITVQGLIRSVASGAYFVLADLASSVNIDPIPGNTGVIYVGTAPTVSSSDPSVFKVIPIVGAAVTNWNGLYEAPPDRDLPYNLIQYWISGTTSDKFVASYSQL